jgi:16S rRNA (guanine527-N7)-methyltransferase
MTMQEKLADGLGAMGLDVPPETQRRLLDFIGLLAKWNRVHNLTAVRDPEQMVTMHLLDSLSVLPYIPAGRLIDVGSGGGLPAIPLAIMRPDVQVTSLDSSHKKTAFQRQVKAELALANFEVVCSRVEHYHPELGFDTVIARAFSELAEFMRLTAHLGMDGCTWLAMKGVYPYDEIAQLDGHTVEAIPLRVPGLEAQRHLIRIRKIQ